MRTFRGVCLTLSAALAACSSDPTPGDAQRDAGRSDAISTLDGSRTDDGGGDLDGALGDSSTMDVPDALAPGDRGPCNPAGQCSNDSRCVSGRCIQWQRGEFDRMCTRTISPGPLRPAIQCAWSGPRDPETDLAPTFRSVLHTPIVANLRIQRDADTPSRPSIIFIADNGYTERPAPGRRCNGVGVLRVIDGATCYDQAAATNVEDRLNSPVTPAVGDLDGDGRLEIVAARMNGGLAAFQYDPTTRNVRRLWQSRLASGAEDTTGGSYCSWSAIALHDLDNDGRAEILFEDGVYRADGVRIATNPGWTNYLSTGSPSVIADVDNDDEPELVTPRGTYRWDRATTSFVMESYWAGTAQDGYVAVADFGDFPGMAGDAPGRPEVVIVGFSEVILQSIGGQRIARVAAPPVPPAMPTRSQVGGPPTVADFNGDGRPDVGAAFAFNYVVFSMTPPGAVIWSRPSQDASSARTGSSVFDFNGDGRAEVVYSDECFSRVYDGRTGDVVFSQPRFSSTWTENDVVADVDGDGSAEIVSPASGPCRMDTYCPHVDPIAVALRCDSDRDCPGGTCSVGFCRCTMTSQCGDSAECMDAPAGTPGVGQVCRTVHAGCLQGLRVYRDSRDRWVPTRPIWNQHAYSITNIEDDGRLVRSSMVRRNWQTRGLNNFRQNEARDPSMIPGADVTAANLQAICEGMGTRMSASVCNRGRVLLDRGVEVIFRLRTGGTELCRLRTNEPIAPGACTPVDCFAPVPARGIFEAIVNPDGTLGECNSDNNNAEGEAFCIG
ncbi:MAG: VCBS repeat-containing protein [Deltaproteobacteria bacterium]|nr:VCBS repeat-containing protein [Deltaproteobacteria bacterium]